MTSAPPPQVGPARGSRMTFAAGGWVLLLAALLTVFAALFWLAPVLTGRGGRALGDGRHVETYGFDLGTCLVDRDLLVAAGIAKNGLPSLDDPQVMTADDVDAMNRADHAKFLVPGDRVIGVAIGDAARAYPVRMLNWREVVNDRLGGRAIAVSYSPLGDAAVVFDREVAGETLTFGAPGLLYNSNSLVFDRRAGGVGESLWAPLQFRAIAGPAAAAGRTLAPIPCQLVSWADWRTHHPGTTVPRPEPNFKRRYQEDPYSTYYAGESLRFPVRPHPAGEPPPKTPVVVLESGAERAVLSVPDLAARTGDDGLLPFRIGGRHVRLRTSGTPPLVFVETDDEGEPPVLAHAFWFAWSSMHPRDRLTAP